MTTIRTSTRAYEQFLEAVLGDALVADDLEKKRRKMRQSPFTFLRATFWRFSEIVFEVAPDLARLPRVSAVGDIHIENYGTWRDADGRLVWGVNDLDEAAEMPFGVDLARLGASALLARGGGAADARTIAAAIVAGYRKGLEAPRPFVLDRDHKWLRKLVQVSENARIRFWTALEAEPVPDPPTRFVAALAAAVPDAPLVMRFGRRSAGTGSLGRLRILGRAEWRGAPLLREGKALVPSAWTRGPGGLSCALRVEQVAAGPFRAPDPWMIRHGDVLVRRISPNSRKIEVEDANGVLLAPRMLRAMGFELANIHLGGGVPPATLRRSLDRLPKTWLLDSAEAIAGATERDFQEFRNGD